MAAPDTARGYGMDQLTGYVTERPPERRGEGKRLPVYLGLAALLAAASLAAVNAAGGKAPSPRVIRPGAGSACNGTPGNGFLYANTVDGTTLRVCVSQEGNINQIEYPAPGNTQIAWDGYCLIDGATKYADFSPGSGVTFTGWGAATLTQTPNPGGPVNQVSVKRTTLDGKYELSEFIKISFQPRSIFVGMTIKNVDPANVTHQFTVMRSVAPALDGSAANDQYNEFGAGLVVVGQRYGGTGQAFQSPGPGTNSLLFGPTQNNGVVYTSTLANFRTSGCQGTAEPPGLQPSGDRVFVGSLGDPATGFKNFTLAHNASARVGKFVYRML